MNAHDLEADIKPSASAGLTGRRARAAGKLGSLLRVRGTSGSGSAQEEEEVIIGLSLLRLEMVDGDLSVQINEQPAAGEAGVNAAGGLATRGGDKLPVGGWRVKAFKETLAGAK